MIKYEFRYFVFQTDYCILVGQCNKFQILKPKSTHNTNFFWLLLFLLLVFIHPLKLVGQEKAGSLSIQTISEDSLSLHSGQIDSIYLPLKQISNTDIVTHEINEKIDSAFNPDVEKWGRSSKVTNPVINHSNLKKVLPNAPNLGLKTESKGVKLIKDQRISIPKRQLNQVLDLNRVNLDILPSRLKEYTNLKSDIVSSLRIDQPVDSLNLKSIESKVEDLAKDNVGELQELDKMEKTANNARFRVKEIKWDKSKINSSKNVAKVLSENVEAVQTGMKKMNDFKSKYSKVNLMNPNGPVLNKIDKKPVEPWQFSLNFSSQFQNGFAIQLAPTIGYKILEKWIGGIGFSYQNKIVDVDSSFSISPRHQFSHRVFNQYNFFRNYFIHIEHELPYRQRNRKEDSYWNGLVPQKPRFWTGLAIQYDIYKSLKGQTQILYNLIRPSGREVGSSRWAIRFNLIL